MSRDRTPRFVLPRAWLLVYPLSVVEPFIASMFISRSAARKQVFETACCAGGGVIPGSILDRHPRGFRPRVSGKPSNPDIRLARLPPATRGGGGGGGGPGSHAA